MLKISSFELAILSSMRFLNICHNWLNNYAYNSSIKLWYFISATLISGTITAIILLQTYHAAVINPSKLIKYA